MSIGDPFNCPPDWPAALRSTLTEGMNILQLTPVTLAELADSIGVVGIDEITGEAWARYIPKDAVLKQLLSESEKRVIRAPAPEGKLTVLCLVHRANGSHQSAVFSQSIRPIAIATQPGSTEAN